MALRWSTTNTVSTHGVKMLIYGGAGAGKTWLIQTLPSPLVASAESGLLVLRKLKIPYAEIKTLADLNEFYQWCVVNAVRYGVQSIVIDSITEIAEVVLGNEKRMTKDPRQAYGELITKVDAIVRAFRDLPGVHVYISAKMELFKDDLGRLMFLASMPGSKLGQALPYYFDEVFYLGVAEKEGVKYRYLQTDASSQYVAKDRSGSLATYEPPDLGHIINKILGVQK